MDSINSQQIQPDDQTLSSKEDGSQVIERATVPSDDPSLPEGGWGWVIVASVFCISIVIQRALGVFFVEWKHYFDASATEVSWAVSMPPAVMGILSPIAGALCLKFGSRKVALVGSALNMLGYLLACFAERVVHLYICIGLIASSGTAMMFTPALVMLGHYFHKRYVLANGIALCGFSFSQILIPRLAQYLIEVYGWRGAMLILTAIGAHSIPCSILLRPRRQHRAPTVSTDKVWEVTHDNTELQLHESNIQTRDIWTSTSSLHLFDSHVDITKSTTRLNASGHADINTKVKKYRRNSPSCTCSNFPLFAPFKSMAFTTLLSGTLCGGVGFFVTIAHLVARAVHAGISRNNAAFLVTVVGLGSLVGRGGHAILIDRQLVSRDIVFIGAFIITALMSFLNPLLDTFPTLCVFAILYGIGNGTVSALMFAMIRLQVSAEQAPVALSFGTLTFTVSGMAGGVIAGLLFDITGNYDISFYFAGAMLSIGTVFILVSFLKARRKK